MAVVDYMSLEGQVDVDYSRARRRALLQNVRIDVRRDADSGGPLLCFDDLRSIPGALVHDQRGLCA